MTILRPYQAEVVEKIRAAFAKGIRRILLVSPTGSGKTVIGCEVISGAVADYWSALVLAHRREIVLQTSRKLFSHGVEHGVILAGTSPRPMERVQIASIQTLHARAVRAETMPLPPAKLIDIDECHHARAQTYQEIIKLYPDAFLLGKTATPCRGDGRGLGNVFDEMIECPQVAELIEQGYLVKSLVYAPVDPNLAGVKTQSGDYVISQLSDRMNSDRLVGDIVTHWHKYGEQRKTVCFACDVAHSQHIADEFVRSGVRAEHLDGSTPIAEREAILARLESGETQVVSNCMVLTEGFDLPAIGALILARPTKQMGLFRQMIGRALRPADGKTDAVILDHSGAVFRHGLPEDRVEWTLATDRRAANPVHEARQAEPRSRLLECTQCSSIRTAGLPCPHCGFLPKPPPRYVPVADGDLGLVADGAVHGPVHDTETRHEWRRMLTHIAYERGYQRGWVAHKYREKFGNWPPYGEAAPKEPTPEVLSWVRSRAIAFAKSRQSA